MKLYLLNVVDEDSVQAEVEDKRGRENLVNYLLAPSQPYLGLQSAQQAAQKHYEDVIAEANGEADPGDEVWGAYQLDWKLGENRMESEVELPWSGFKLFFRISAVELAS